MLCVQKLLMDNHPNGFEVLEKEYAIHSKFHPSDDLVILDYDQLDSPKHEEIVRECRGLVLNSKDYSLVSRSFRRFFNGGENRVDDNIFDWDYGAHCYEKVDGSMIQLFYHNNQWKITTRFSFAEHEISSGKPTWSQLFFATFGEWRIHYLDKSYTYVFELCTNDNKIVTRYTNDFVSLLTVFFGEVELSPDAVNSIAQGLDVHTPECKIVNDIFEAQAFLRERVDKDQTFEGVVVRDCHNNRLKLKSEIYLRLHKHITRNNFDDETCLLIFIDGQGSEFLQYFPELKEKVQNIGIDYVLWKEKVKNEFDSLSQQSLSQKEYALKVKDLPYSHVMFELRRGKSFEEIIEKLKTFNGLDKIIPSIRGTKC